MWADDGSTKRDRDRDRLLTAIGIEVQRYGANMILERRPAAPKVIASLIVKDDIAVARRGRLAAVSLQKVDKVKVGWSPPAAQSQVKEPDSPA